MADNEVYIFDVTESNFNTSVILNSHKIPVLAFFMGAWSEHCIVMSDTFERLAKEFAGQFIFARVDIDEQPELRKEYAIQNVPTLKVIQNGDVTQTEEGMMEQDEAREFLKRFGIFRESDALREQARARHMAGGTVEAIGLLTQAIKQDPANTRVAMDMVQIFIDINELEQAKALYNKLPDRDRESDTGKILLGQMTFLELAANTDGKDALQARLDADENDDDERFDLAVCLVAERDFQQAMENLFEIHKRNPDYKEGAAREMIISLINMLTPNDPEMAQQFRRRLGTTTH